jgi:hypothetical protein
MKLNLLYHVYPCAKNDTWLWNLHHIRNHFDLFDRVIIGVAQDDMSAPLVALKQLLVGSPNVELLLSENNRAHGELTTLPYMLDLVKSDRSDEATFYAHAKGVSHSGPRLMAVKQWTKAMLDFNLDMKKVEPLLAVNSCVGTFKRSGIGIVSNKFNWHYSGNFWWVNHAALFGLDWRSRLVGRRHAAESFLGWLFPSGQAACNGASGVLPLYSLRAWSAPNGRNYLAVKKACEV